MSNPRSQDVSPPALLPPSCKHKHITLTQVIVKYVDWEREEDEVFAVGDISVRVNTIRQVVEKDGYSIVTTIDKKTLAVIENFDAIKNKI